MGRCTPFGLVLQMLTALASNVPSSPTSGASNVTVQWGGQSLTVMESSALCYRIECNNPRRAAWGIKL